MDLFFTNPDNEVQKHIDNFNIKYLRLLTLVFGLIQFGYFILTYTSYFDCPERMEYRILYIININVKLLMNKFDEIRMYNLIFFFFHMIF
jgi:hypothetical protein